MMKINDFCKLYKISVYRLAACIKRPYEDGETDQQHMRRKDKWIRRKADSGHLIMYVDGVVTIERKSGRRDSFEASELNDFITCS